MVRLYDLFRFFDSSDFAFLFSFYSFRFSFFVSTLEKKGTLFSSLLSLSSFVFWRCCAGILVSGDNKTVICGLGTGHNAKGPGQIFDAPRPSRSTGCHSLDLGQLSTASSWRLPSRVWTTMPLPSPKITVRV